MKAFLIGIFCVTSCVFFFFNDTATTEIYTLSLHDALPISEETLAGVAKREKLLPPETQRALDAASARDRKKHTSELQSLAYLVCRLLLEKKKKTAGSTRTPTKTQRSTPTLHNA